METPDASLAWPDRYFFYRAFIACSISARRKKRVWSRSITRVVLDTSEPKKSTPPVGSEVSRTTGVMERDQTLFFSTGAYTASDKRPVEKNCGLATRD